MLWKKKIQQEGSNCTTVTVSERLSSNCKDCLIIFHRISFIDKMKSSIREICWGTTWFWRIYIWRDICKAHEFDRIIRRAIIRKHCSKPNMDMGRMLQETSLSFAFSHEDHIMRYRELEKSPKISQLWKVISRQIFIQGECNFDCLNSARMEKQESFKIWREKRKTNTLLVFAKVKLGLACFFCCIM